MKRISLINRKIQEYINHCIYALDFFYKNDFEHSLTDFRKSGEAFMKILIIDKFGDLNGHKIIVGEIDMNLNPCSTHHDLQYNELLKVIEYKNILNISMLNRLKDIQRESNPTAHNPNRTTSPSEFRANSELCKVQSNELKKYIFRHLGETIPANLQEAFEGDINTALITDLKSSSWEELFQYIDAFIPQNKYVLIAPPKFNDCTELQLQILSRIDWSFIVDFDPSSKKDGLFKAFLPIYENRCVPITIKQQGQKGIVGTGAHGNANWFFANGLITIPETVSANIRGWIKLKYHNLTKELFRDFCSKSLNRYIIMYLYDDIDYVEEVVRAISDIDVISTELVEHVFITNNQDIIDRIESFEKYDIQFRTFKISISEIISELSSLRLSDNNKVDAIFVPARTKQEEQTVIDISNIYNKLLGGGITVVHQNIDQITPLSENEIPLFYQGEQISWKELSLDIEVRRNKYDDLLSKIRSHLISAKKSVKYEILHKPGAGGTTISRRIAYDLRKDFPVVLISHFSKLITSRELLLLIDVVNKPILAVIEASNVGVNDLEELIRICNTAKQTVIFAYVRRELNRSKDSELVTCLSDTMTDINEKEKFVNKSQLYSKNKKAINTLSKLTINNCEVIDFSLAIADDTYNKERLEEYVKSYISDKKMPDSHVHFLTYVSIIYYYSQKSVSEYLLRSLFKKTLSEDLNQIAYSDQMIRKILIQEQEQVHDGLQNTDYWRPRFSKFAEIVLTVVLGGKNKEDWKEQLPFHVTELIKLIKRSNTYLVDETRDLLKSIFLERNNEDLLGKEEQWQSKTSNDQFSTLLKDVSDKRTQKQILLTLAESYPTEPHFWGHLARFVYEKAEDEVEFIEAEKFVKLSFENGGESDYNLQHIGGMCKRRQIEFYKRNYSKENGTKISEEKIQELANEANEYFNSSRLINPHNIHAYIAQIQTLIVVLDLGKEISGIIKKETFITHPKNSWYLQQYEVVSDLIEDAKALIEQQETLGISNKINKSKSYLATSEGKSYEILGDFHSSIELFKKLITTSEREKRPQLRLMYINSTLLSKVKGDKNRMNEAWLLLNKKEIENIEKTLTDNILQDNQNIHTLRVWFRFVRYSIIDISIDEVISRLKIWYENSESNYVLHLEAAYYLYVFYACLAIKAKDSFSQINLKEIYRYIDICKSLSQNSKFAFEWLSKNDGLDCLLNYKNKIIDDNGCLDRVTGTISKIISRQQGQLSLHCGLTAFFVPYYGNFIQGQDETTEVSFYIGFRHDGLFALDVQRTVYSQEGNGSASELQDIVQIVEKIEEIESIEGTDEKVEINNSQPFTLKIVGQIDLSKFEKYKKKKSEKKPK